MIAEYKDKLIILDGEFQREHVYFIPKIRIDHYGDKRVYNNISEESLKEFEIYLIPLNNTMVVILWMTLTD